MLVRADSVALYKRYNVSIERSAIQGLWASLSLLCFAVDEDVSFPLSFGLILLKVNEGLFHSNGLAFSFGLVNSSDNLYSSASTFCLRRRSYKGILSSWSSL